MKKPGLMLLIMLFSTCAIAQYSTSPVRLWDKYPSEVHQRGFGVYKSQLVQMDDDPQLEEVFLFSSDNGHYPYFDLFKIYFVVMDYYTKQVKYQSDVVISSERTLTLEDRNNDGRFELYRRYFKDGEFTVDKDGNNLSVKWAYDSISFK